jgi:hypothetical protein
LREILCFRASRHERDAAREQVRNGDVPLARSTSLAARVGSAAILSLTIAIWRFRWDPA